MKDSFSSKGIESQSARLSSKTAACRGLAGQSCGDHSPLSHEKTQPLSGRLRRGISIELASSWFSSSDIFVGLCARKVFVSAIVTISFLLSGVTSYVRADEPYRQFLERLKNEQLFDLAIVYLDDLENRPNLEPEFRSEIELERAMLLYQSAAVLSPQAPLRDERLKSAEAAIREFLENRKQHPRRGEARLKLGELLLTRAEEAKQFASTPDGEAIPEAVNYFDEAHQVFEQTIEELAAEYQKVKGNRTNTGDAEQISKRRELQENLRQAQLLSAKAIEDRGSVRAKDSPTQKQDYEEALRRFSDLYLKEQRMVGVRNYALFYRSQIQSKLGKTEDAIDGFRRIADLEGVDLLRPLQTDAVAELVALLASSEKYPLAVDRGEDWLAKLRPDERQGPGAVQLRLKLSQVKMAWAEKLLEKDPADRVGKRLKRDLRGELRSLLRVVGPHLETTRELLSELGVESAGEVDNDQELPTVTTFEEALAEAQQRIDQAEADALTLAVIQEEIDDPAIDEATRKDRIAKLEQVENSVSQKRELALELLRTGLRLFGEDDDRARLFDARFRIAYVLLKLQRAWDAIVVGEFLARSNPSTEEGLRAAVITLSGYSDLLKLSGSQRTELIEQLEPFAEYLVETWPQSAEASAAASALVSLAVNAKQWEKAEQFLELIPSGAKATSKLQRDLGAAFYAAYLKQKDSATEADAAQLENSAAKWLKLGLDGIGKEDLDGGVIESMNALARLLLSQENVEEAGELLLGGDASATAWLAENSDQVRPRTAMETYRSAIQIVAAKLVENQIPAKEAVSEMQRYVGRLQEIGDSAADGKRLLTGIFLGLARDLKQKLSETQQPARRERLASVVLLVVKEAASSDAFSTQYWAADTLVAIAEELASSRSSEQAALDGYRNAIEVLEGILGRAEKQTDWIQPEGAAIQIRRLLAQAQRGVGDFKSAVLGLGEILDDNTGLLDIQIEAAKSLAEWGTEKAGFHRLAIVGGRKSAQSGQNVIWGWGKIAQVTANQPKFEEQFFQARYELARNRYLYAKSLEDLELQKKELAKAKKDITSTAALYPDLGGAEQRQKFVALLKSIQTALGEPPVGLE